MPNTLASSNTVAKPETRSGKLRSVSPLTLRRIILAVYLSVVVLMASFGAYATRSIGTLGDLTDQALGGSSLSVGDAAAQSASARLGQPADDAVQNDFQSSGRIRAKAVEAKFLTLLWISAAVVLGGVLLTLLARRVMEALANLSAAIRRSEAGEADMNVLNGSVNAAGALRTTIGTMRANIIAMTALEAASRQTGEASSSAAIKRSNGPAVGRKRAKATVAPSTTEGG